jgi:hypothetical protein
MSTKNPLVRLPRGRTIKLMSDWQKQTNVSPDSSAARCIESSQWNQHAPWKDWGIFPGGGRVDVISKIIAGALNLDWRDLMIREAGSVTMLWWIWSQPFCINVSQVGSTVVIRAGGASLAFKDINIARYWAFEHNQTTTLWHWYAEPHPTIPKAGVWRSFTKICISTDSEEKDISFAASLLMDMAADHALKHYNNTTHLEYTDGPEELVALPEMWNAWVRPSIETMTPIPGYKLAGSLYRSRLERVSSHRMQINQNPGPLPPKFVLQNDLPNAYTKKTVTTDFSMVLVKEDQILMTSFDRAYRIETPGLVINMRTDVVNPAMGEGLLIHVPVLSECTYDDLEQLNKDERISKDPVSFIGAWADDPLRLWSTAIGLPGGFMGIESGMAPAHTAFYPNRYRIWTSGADIIERIYSRTLRV